MLVEAKHDKEMLMDCLPEATSLAIALSEVTGDNTVRYRLSDGGKWMFQAYTRDAEGNAMALFSAYGSLLSSLLGMPRAILPDHLRPKIFTSRSMRLSNASFQFQLIFETKLRRSRCSGLVQLVPFFGTSGEHQSNGYHVSSLSFSVHICRRSYLTAANGISLPNAGVSRFKAEPWYLCLSTRQSTSAKFIHEWSAE